MNTHDFEALATAICHPLAGRISWTCVSPGFDRATKTWLPDRWEASAWICSPWVPFDAPTMLELIHLLHARLGRPSFPREAVELEQAREDVEAILCAPERVFTHVERYGGEWPASHLTVRYRVGLGGVFSGWTTWCNGDTPALAFRCAAAVLRGDLRPGGPREEAELIPIAPREGLISPVQGTLSFVDGA